MSDNSNHKYVNSNSNSNSNAKFRDDFARRLLKLCYRTLQLGKRLLEKINTNELIPQSETFVARMSQVVDPEFQQFIGSILMDIDRFGTERKLSATYLHEVVFNSPGSSDYNQLVSFLATQLKRFHPKRLREYSQYADEYMDSVTLITNSMD